MKLKTGVEKLDELLKDGIEYPDGRGLFGVIVGAAGSGKSVLGLQMCCRFVLQGKQHAKSDCSGPAAVYISQEPAWVVRQKIWDGFGDFETDPSDAGGEPWIWWERSPGEPEEADVTRDKTKMFLAKQKELREQDLLAAGPPALYICELPLDLASQTAKLENIFDIAASKAREWRGQSSSPQPLVVVDNAETIYDRALLDAMRERNPMLKSLVAAAASAGTAADEQGARVDEFRHEDPNFYRRVRRYCGRNGVHSFFIFEEQSPNGQNPEVTDVSTTPEAYAADVVMRLGLQTHKTGFRERFIEIVKAKNQFYYRGKHSFSVVGLEKDPATNDSEETPARGITIYPSIATQLSWLRKKRGQRNADGQPNSKRHNLGISSLDKAICALLRGVTEDKVGDETGYIPVESSSALVSDLDLKATQIALHFLLSADCGLFISFFHEEKDLRQMADRFEALKGRVRTGAPQDPFVFKFFPPEHISTNKLFRDIRLLIESVKRPRGTAGDDPVFAIVVDNVLELQCKYPLLENQDHFLTALYELFRVEGATSLIVDTVETGEARNPIEASRAAGLADNVFLLRHVEFQSRPHHVFSVVKLLGSAAAERLWDLEEERGKDDKWRLTTKPTFELYQNVLSGKPEPVTFVFTLFQDAEGSPFHAYLKGQERALYRTLGAKVEVNLYGAEEYARVQNILRSSTPRPRPECHIVALDEFWLQELIRRDALEDIGSLVNQGDLGQREFARREQYVSAAHDMALYQLACEQPEPVASNWYTRWFAIPARNNCGILCCAPDEVRKHLDSANLSRNAENALNGWLARRGNRLTWQHLHKLKRALEPKGWKGDKHHPKVFFTFCRDLMESCVSFMLELALSFAKHEKLFSKAVDAKTGQELRTYRMNIGAYPPEALILLFELLEEEDVNALAAGVFRPSGDEPTALFSRQWMSTLGCLRMCKRTDEDAGPRGIERAQDERYYFRQLEPFELPNSPTYGHPTPVSGTWYAGILKGSAAVEAGARVIQQFTSVANEIYKLNNYIGLPVRRAFYEAEKPEGAPALAFPIPYRREYARLAKLQAETVLARPQDGEGKTKADKENLEPNRDVNTNTGYETEVMRSVCPFYRPSIDDYEHVAPVLWRLLVRAAQEFKRAQPDGGKLRRQFKRVAEASAGEYEALEAARLPGAP